MAEKMPSVPSPRTRIEVRIPSTVSNVPPEVAGFFHFSTLGDVAQMSVGFLDAPVPTAGKPLGNSVIIEPTITHRFHMSVGTLVMLKKQVDELHANLTALGVLGQNPMEPQKD